MDNLAYGFWGAYFGAAALMLAGSVLAFHRSLHRISRNAALSATASSFFVLAFLGGLPIEGEGTLARFLAHVAIAVSAVLAYLLFSIMGVLAKPDVRRRSVLALVVLVLAGVSVGWLLPPMQALGVGVGIACSLGLVGLVVTLRSALRGDRLAWVAVGGVFFLLLAMVGLSGIALARGQVSWPVHAVTALSATAYLTMMASALWARYSYLIELHQVMALGPSYDPVTRMLSHTETGQMIGDAFKTHRSEPAVLGVMVVSLGNLYALEKLHGMAAVNHALFVCAGRLRRTVPNHVEMGRLSTDGFLLLIRDCKDSGELIRLSHMLVSRLSREVVLNTSMEPDRREDEQTRWQAEVGVGVLLVSDPAAMASGAVASSRAMSRTAMSYASRVAWLDEVSGEAVELPVLEPS